MPVAIIAVVAAVAMALLFDSWLAGKGPGPLPVGSSFRAVPVRLPQHVKGVREFVPNPSASEWAFKPGRFMIRDHWNNEVIGGLTMRFTWQYGRTDYMEVAEGVYRTKPQLGVFGKEMWSASEVEPGVFELPREAWGKVLCLHMLVDEGFIPATCAFRMTSDGRLTLMWGSLLAEDSALPKDVQAAVKAMGDPATRPQRPDPTQLVCMVGCMPAISVLPSGELSMKLVDEAGDPMPNLEVSVGANDEWRSRWEERDYAFVRARQRVVSDADGFVSLRGVVGSLGSSGQPTAWRNIAPVQDPRMEGGARAEHTVPAVVTPGMRLDDGLYVVRAGDHAYASPSDSTRMVEDSGDVTTKPVKPEERVRYEGVVYLDHPRAFNRSESYGWDKGAQNADSGEFFAFDHDPGAVPVVEGRRELLAGTFVFQDGDGKPVPHARLNLHWSEDKHGGTARDGEVFATIETGADGTCVVWAPEGTVAARFLRGNWRGLGMRLKALNGAFQGESEGVGRCQPCGHLAVTRSGFQSQSWMVIRPTGVDGGAQGTRVWRVDSLQKFGGRGQLFTGLMENQFLFGEYDEFMGPGTPYQAKVVAHATARAEVPRARQGTEWVMLSAEPWKRLNGGRVIPRVLGEDSMLQRYVAESGPQAFEGMPSRANLTMPFPGLQAPESAWRVVRDGAVSVPKAWVEWGMVIQSLLPAMYTEPGLPGELRPFFQGLTVNRLFGDNVRPLTLTLGGGKTADELLPYAVLIGRERDHVALIPCDGREHTVWIPVNEGYGTHDVKGEFYPRKMDEEAWTLTWRYAVMPMEEEEAQHWRKDVLGSTLPKECRTSCRLTIPEGNAAAFLSIVLPSIRNHPEWTQNGNGVEASKLSNPVAAVLEPMKQGIRVGW